MPRAAASVVDTGTAARLHSSVNRMRRVADVALALELAGLLLLLVGGPGVAAAAVGRTVAVAPIVSWVGGGAAAGMPVLAAARACGGWAASACFLASTRAASAATALACSAWSAAAFALEASISFALSAIVASTRSNALCAGFALRVLTAPRSGHSWPWQALVHCVTLGRGAFGVGGQSWGQASS